MSSVEDNKIYLNEFLASCSLDRAELHRQTRIHRNETDSKTEKEWIKLTELKKSKPTTK